MKFSAVAVLALAFVAHSFPQVEAEIDCKELCAEVVTNDYVLAEVDRACNKFRYELPRPRVWSACRTGFAQTQGKVCQEVCEQREAFGSWQVPRANCQGAKNQSPKPKMYNACVTGASTAAKTVDKLTLAALENGGVVPSAPQKEISPKKKTLPKVVEPKKTVEEVVYNNPEPAVEKVPVIEEATPPDVKETSPEEFKTPEKVIRLEEDQDEDEALRLLEEQIQHME